MEPTIQEQLEKRLVELPEDIQQAVAANDLEQRVRAIGAAHNLHIDQIGALGDEAMLVMLGFSDINRFADTIAAQVKVSSEDAGKLAAEIGEKVFLPIRESLKRFMELRSQAPMHAPVQPTAPTPAAVAASAPKMPPTPASQPIATPPQPAGVLKELENPLARPELPMAEKMLTQKTVAVAKPAAATSAPTPKPVGYKADPYREPVE